MASGIVLGIAGDMVHGTTDAYTTKIGGSPVRSPPVCVLSSVASRLLRVKLEHIAPPQAWMGDVEDGCPPCKLCGATLSLAMQARCVSWKLLGRAMYRLIDSGPARWLRGTSKVPRRRKLVEQPPSL